MQNMTIVYLLFSHIILNKEDLPMSWLFGDSLFEFKLSFKTKAKLFPIFFSIIFHFPCPVGICYTLNVSKSGEYILFESRCRFPSTLYQYEIIHKSTTSMDLKRKEKRNEKKTYPSRHVWWIYIMLFRLVRWYGDTYSLNRKYFPKTNRNCDTHHKTKLNNS